MSTRPDDESTDKPERPSKPGSSASGATQGTRSFGGIRPPRRPGGRGGGGRGRTGGSGRSGGGGAAGRRPGPLALTILILVALGALILLASRTWTEVLWYNQLGFSRIVWTRWIAAGALFVVGFATMFGAVHTAISRAYKAREIHLPRDESSRNLEAYRTAIEPMRRTLT